MKRSIYTNIFYVTIAIIIAVVIAMMFIGCAKEYVEHPTHFRVYELSDKYNSKKSFDHSDSLWPWGIYNNAFDAKDTMQFSNYNDTSSLLGCERDGYQRFRYVIGNKITYPKIYN